MEQKLPGPATLLDNSLRLVKYFPVYNGFMVITDVILFPLACVLDRSMRQIIHCKGLLIDHITAVLLVGQDPAH
ncbi:hypothetical protein SDC9_155340 [bioreactor metagenome]|uniref:Uncharacterized protein n=1 Tax=bioreactor metagenome TaxID=1076179 RepID=A0A645F628_9ZZZZ